MQEPQTDHQAQKSWEFPTFNTGGITDGPRMPDTCSSARIPTELPTERKHLAGFSIFLVRISINFRRNYQRKLIALTAINFRQKYCFIYRPSPPPLRSFSPLLLFSLSLLPCSSPLLPFSSHLYLAFRRILLFWW